MKHFHLLTAILWIASLPALAIPNQIGGFLANLDSPLNDTELGEDFLDDALWAGNGALPGEWKAEAPIGPVSSSWLAARPKVFGLPALLVQASHRDGKLEGLAITFADAGSYFGYLDEKLPAGLSPREQREELLRRLADRQAAFAKFFTETETNLRSSLAELTGDRPRDNKIGKTRALRAEVLDYEKGDLLLRLVVGGERLIRLLIVPDRLASRTWLDAERAALSESELLQVYEEQVRETPDGDLRIDRLPLVPQGYKPYCGLNTLTMAARYFGLHIDEDWLAVAGGFQNTGSAAGSQIPRLYLAVAKEAGLDLHRANDFSLSDARDSLDHGLPIVVWRRFSAERNRIHTEQTRAAGRDPSYVLPRPDDATRQSWPGSNAPLHASVIVGYNADRREVLFLESWAGMSEPRRMREEEMAATAYLSFYFKH